MTPSTPPPPKGQPKGPLKHNPRRDGPKPELDAPVDDEQMSRYQDSQGHLGSLTKTKFPKETK